MSDYLPQDVVIKILKRLPPKSLIKFKCVSKSWNSIISSSHFISVHTQYQTALPKSITIIRYYSNTQNTEIYSIHNDNNQEFLQENIKIEYPFRDYTRYYYRIVGSCNGVLCLSDDLFGLSNSIILWNPVIKTQVRLPPPKSNFDNMETYMFVLGFGFDVQNNDYKVVKLSYFQRDYGYEVPPKVEVYALSTRNWHEVKGQVPRNCVVEYFWTQVFITGNVHWVAYRNYEEEDKCKFENLIMAFDISLEVFNEMKLPDALENELPINLNVAVLQESLAVFQYNVRMFSSRCSIYVMKKYGDADSWSKEYNVRLQGLGAVVGFRTNGDVLLTARNRGLVSYNPNTEEDVDLGSLGTKNSFYVGEYVESLVLLNEGYEAREKFPSDGESESECESCAEDEDGDGNENEEQKFGDVEKSEFCMQSCMFQFFYVLYRRSFV